MEAHKQEFLVVYDYGTGGLWGVIRARSADEIHIKYPELSIEAERPKWLTDEIMLGIRRAETHDIDDEPAGLLRALLTDRNR